MNLCLITDMTNFFLQKEFFSLKRQQKREQPQTRNVTRNMHKHNVKIQIYMLLRYKIH